MLKLNKQNLIIIFLLFLLVIFSYTFFDDLKPIQISDELGFYQINTCSFSIMEFQLNNTHTLYQDTTTLGLITIQVLSVLEKSLVLIE